MRLSAIIKALLGNLSAPVMVAPHPLTPRDERRIIAIWSRK